MNQLKVSSDDPENLVLGMSILYNSYSMLPSHDQVGSRAKPLSLRRAVHDWNHKELKDQLGSILQ